MPAIQLLLLPTIDRSLPPWAGAGATAYAPLPTDEEIARGYLLASGEPKPLPTDDGGYEPLPTEIDTRDGKPGGTK